MNVFYVRHRLFNVVQLVQFLRNFLRAFVKSLKVHFDTVKSFASFDAFFLLLVCDSSFLFFIFIGSASLLKFSSLFFPLQSELSSQVGSLCGSLFSSASIVSFASCNPLGVFSRFHVVFNVCFTDGESWLMIAFRSTINCF